MGWQGWLFGCGGLLVIALVVVAYFAIVDRKRKNRVLASGSRTTGWLVQANVKLFEKGFMDLPALVLISPDERTAKDEELMLVLAEDCSDEDEAFIAGLMADETYIEGKRDQLPRRFATGRDVYLAHIFVYRNDLPDERIVGNQVPCAVIWEEPGSLICTYPAYSEANLGNGSSD
jgi:hypothetical protein